MEWLRVCLSGRHPDHRSVPVRPAAVPLRAAVILFLRRGSAQLSSGSRAPSSARNAEFAKKLIGGKQTPLPHPALGNDAVGFIFGNEVGVSEISPFGGCQVLKHSEHFLKHGFRELVSDFQFPLMRRAGKSWSGSGFHCGSPSLSDSRTERPDAAS